MASQPFIPGDFQNPQRKILQELNLKKQLLKSGTAQTLNPCALNTPIGISTLSGNPPPENQMSSNTRSALQHANITSMGYFVGQDSAFGNNILAVLPRFSDSK